tara:strand:+ start:3496 stop:3687 length:192 start_codon:yes stop_codon:yes gene_type:complete
MSNIYHNNAAVLAFNGEKRGAVSVCLFDHGTVIIGIDADSLRAFAKLLNDAVDALPAKIEEAA